jgi:hypothetical protein
LGVVGLAEHRALGQADARNAPKRIHLVAGEQGGQPVGFGRCVLCFSILALPMCAPSYQSR